jgi:pimeloyl-ACP methyl ester carboxylesterase
MTGWLAIILGLGGLMGGLAVWTWISALKAERDHPPLGIFVTVTGGRLHLRDMGPRDAPPERTLILLHGASCCHLALTLPLARPLSDFRIIALDRPGQGHSDRPAGAEDASPVRQADYLAEVMDALALPRAIIVAHSLAGAMALTFAMDHPEKIAGMVLLCPVSHPWPGGLTWYYYPASWRWSAAIFSATMPVIGAQLTMQKAIDGVFHPQKAPADYSVLTALDLVTRPKAFRANAEDVTALYGHVTERSPHYGKIKAPVVVISGEDDKTVYTSIHTAGLRDQLPDVKVHILPGVGHVPHHADTDLVVGEIRALSVRLMA